MTEELTIKVTADTSDFKRGMDDVEKKLDKTTSKTDSAQGRWGDLSKKLSAISPTFAKASSGVAEQSSKIEDAFGSGSAAAGLFKLGAVGAIAAIGVKAGQVAWKVASETAKMFDPQGYSKAAGSMQKSIKKLKTTIGSFTAPIVNGIMTVVSKVVDGITWILQKIRIFRAFVWGMVKTILQPVIDGIKQVIAWIQQGINMLSNLLGFGDVFKAPAQSAEDAAESMGEVVEATSAGLASFDQLNTLDTSNSGDTETAEELSSNIADAEAFGADLVGKIGDFFSNFDFGAIWDGFADAAGQAWDGICNVAGDAWEGIKGFGESCWDGIKGFGESCWNGIRGFGEAVWGGIQAVASAVWQGIQAYAQAVWTVITAWATYQWELIKAIATAVWTVISTVATTVWNVINTVATTVWNTILSVAQTVWGVISGTAMAVWEGIKTIATTVWGVIQTVATTAWTIISTPILALWDAFQNAGSTCWGILQALGEAFNRVVINPIKSAVQWCMDKIEWVLGKIEGAKNALGNLTSGISNFVKDPVGSIVGGAKSLLGLADGAVVQPNNPFPVIVGDNTREPEVISPLSTIRQAVTEAMRSQGASGGSSGPIELTVNLDSRKIARAVYDPLQTEARRRGVGA